MTRVFFGRSGAAAPASSSPSAAGRRRARSAAGSAAAGLPHQPLLGGRRFLGRGRRLGGESPRRRLLGRRRRLGAGSSSAAGGVSRGASGAVTSGAASAGVSRPLTARSSLRVSLSRLFLSAISLSLSVLPCGLGFALGLDGQDPRDLALRQLQARAVLERAGHRLEAEVEELLPAFGQPVVELVVRQISNSLGLVKRAQPLSSPLWFSPTASGPRGEALPLRAAPARRRARTSRARA